MAKSVLQYAYRRWLENRAQTGALEMSFGGLLRRKDVSHVRRVLRVESLASRELLHAGDVVGDIASAEPSVDVPAEVSTQAAEGELSAQSLLPDIVPWSSESKGFIHDWTVQGNDLRLSTAMANIGAGPMELRGGATSGSSQEVHQRIYEPSGEFTDVLAGTFTYHPEHGHIHFDGFAEFRLRSVLSDGGVGPIVAAGDKISFCLLDVERYDESGPSTPQFLTCEQVQGISVGWSDVYNRGLPGQSIDISGVANGNYWLEVVVDPDNQLIESNEDNNVVRIQIDLQRPADDGGIPRDVFETNNTFDTASILAPPEDHVYENLSLHASADSDYYRVTASGSGDMEFHVEFDNSQGDIDMEVFDATQTRIGLSDSSTDSEQFEFSATAGTYYFVRVYGYDGATNPNYTFTIHQPHGDDGDDGDHDHGDQFEENDTLATAHSLPGVSQTYTGLSIDAADDDDYFQIVPTTSGTMTVSVAFEQNEGDIDLQILDAAQTRLGISDSTSNEEQISLPVTEGQTYYVRVYGYDGAVNPNYTLTLDLPDSSGGGSGGDRFEQNDAFDTAHSLPAEDQTYTDLSIDAEDDDDYYMIVPSTSGTMTVSGAFEQADGDIDMRIFNASQTQLGISESITDQERISVPVTAGQTYYILMYGFEGAVNPNYSMTIDVPSPADGRTYTALDALIIINYLNRNGPGPVGGGDGDYDLNADGSITALDALWVINRLNRDSNSSTANSERESMDWQSIIPIELQSRSEKLVDVSSANRIVESGWSIDSVDVAVTESFAESSEETLQLLSKRQS